MTEANQRPAPVGTMRTFVFGLLAQQAAPCFFQREYLNWRGFRPYGEGFGAIDAEDHTLNSGVSDDRSASRSVATQWPSEPIPGSPAYAGPGKIWPPAGISRSMG